LAGAFFAAVDFSLPEVFLVELAFALASLAAADSGSVSASADFAAALVRAGVFRFVGARRVRGEVAFLGLASASVFFSGSAAPEISFFGLSEGSAASSVFAADFRAVTLVLVDVLRVVRRRGAGLASVSLASPSASPCCGGEPAGDVSAFSFSCSCSFFASVFLGRPRRLRGAAGWVSASETSASGAGVCSG
jgi:hypothetical protein